MFKILIILTGVTGLFVLGVNLKIFDTNSHIQPSKHGKKNLAPIIKNIDPIPTVETKEPTPKPTKKQHTLLYEMNQLLEQANIAKSHLEFEKSLKLYNQVIETLQTHHEFELEKLYATAEFYKAILLEFNLDNKYEAIQSYQRIAKRYEKRQEITFLLYYAKAQFYHARMVERDKAIEIYNEIIYRFKHSNNTELLKRFAKASFEKSYFSTSYEAIDIYDEIIKKFKNTDNKELLEELYNAQMNKAYVLEHYLEERDETIEVYDQVIEKFSHYKDKESQIKVENALFSKSFLLMGESDEEAIDIFDTLIKRYQKEDMSVVPQNLVYAIVNNIELSLITNNDDSEYQDLAQQYLQNSEDSVTEIEMLEILKNAQEDEQDEAMRRWEEEHKDFQFENWSFAELEQWNAQMEESERKTRIRGYLDRFIQHYEVPKGRNQ